MTTQLGFPFARALGEQHAGIRVALRWIEAELDRRDEAGFARTGALLGALRALRQELGEHFSFEERNGFDGGFASPDGEIQEWTARLVRQHRDFERRLDEFLGQAGEGAFPIALAEGLRMLFDDLRRHDAEEGSLLQRILRGPSDFCERVESS